MKMTFDQYIANPMGIKNAVYSNREMYRNLYSEKLDKIIVREVGKIKYKLYTSKDDRYFVHLKIPSEVIKNFYYDTVIEFYTDQSGVSVSKSLKDYYIRFYSNDPSFVYTFAYAMIKNELFIKDLVPRMSKEAVKKVASEKNPKAEVGYVKSIYFAYLLMRNYSLFDKLLYSTYGENYDKKILLKNIIHADEKVKARQEAAATLSKSKKIQNKKNSMQDRNPGLATVNTSTISNTKGIGNIAKTNRVKNTVNSVRTVHKTKKI